MTWTYIQSILGSGLYWNKTQQELLSAIARANEEGEYDAAGHLRIMLRLRNRVMMESEQKETLPQQG